MERVDLTAHDNSVAITKNGEEGLNDSRLMAFVVAGQAVVQATRMGNQGKIRFRERE